MFLIKDQRQVFSPPLRGLPISKQIPHSATSGVFAVIRLRTVQCFRRSDDNAGGVQGFAGRRRRQPTGHYVAANPEESSSLRLR